MSPSRLKPAAWLPLCLVLATCVSRAAEPKPRIVVLTDIAPNSVEPDDMESMIRLFAHADLFEIEGLVSSTGWSDGGGQERPELIHTAIDAYEHDLANLRKRSGQESHATDESRQEIGYWPSPEYLRSRTVVGSTKRGLRFLGAENDSEGSRLIIREADADDDRPIWVLVWGGGNTLGQAVWRAQQDRGPEELKAFLHKLRAYTITDQDRGYGNTPYQGSSHYWLRKEFQPDLVFLWDESAWNYQNATGKANWDHYAEHIQGHGALGELYPKFKYGVEGDTPSLLYVWPNGLNAPEHPGWGGWGGVFELMATQDKETTAYANQRGTPVYAVSQKYQKRFYPALFNSFAARMDWAKEGAGNREPVVSVNGDTSLAAIRLSPMAGEQLTVDATGTVDPDGNTLTYSWWVLPEAGTYDKELALGDTTDASLTLTPPAEAAGKSIHLICEVTDNGAPNLTAYRRVIIEPTAAESRP